MRRGQLNLWVDIVSLLLFWLVCVTGVILRWSLPPGSGRLEVAHGPVLLLWGWDRHAWGEAHALCSALLMVVLGLHLALHWKWLWGMLKRQSGMASGKRWWLGLIGLLTWVGLSLAPLLSPLRTYQPAAPLADPQAVPQADPGLQLYQEQCQRCHGNDARGIGPLPGDADQARAWLRAAQPANLHQRLQALTPQELDSLVARIRTLQAKE